MCLHEAIIPWDLLHMFNIFHCFLWVGVIINSPRPSSLYFPSEKSHWMDISLVRHSLQRYFPSHLLEPSKNKKKKRKRKRKCRCKYFKPKPSWFSFLLPTFLHSVFLSCLPFSLPFFVLSGFWIIKYRLKSNSGIG